MSKRRNKMPGLRLKGGIWHIEKRCQYAENGWIRESTGLSERAKAEAFLIRRLAELEAKTRRAVTGTHTFEEAGLRYLEDKSRKSSADDIATHLDQLFPFIGHLELEAIHDGTLAPFIEHEMTREVRNKATRGLAPKSINNALGVVSAVLNRASRVWRHDDGTAWLGQPPPKLTQVPTRGNQDQSYSLNWGEQDRLFEALPHHLRDMAEFKVNTGTREQEVCRLRWDWEIDVPEIGSSVFLIPAFDSDGADEDAQQVKNGEDRLIVLNSVAKQIVESRRGVHPTYVFTYGKKDGGHPLNGMNNSGWKTAWRKAGLPVQDDIRRGVHNLKHTLGRRLRAVKCPSETRKALLGHKNGDITTHYSAAELEELIYWLEKAAERKAAQTPTLIALKNRSRGNCRKSVGTEKEKGLAVSS